MIRVLTFAAFAALIGGPSAPAQTQTQTAPREATSGAARAQRDARAVNGPGAGAVKDSLFAQVAATCGRAEVLLGQLGAQKASDHELKEFSQRMIEEHTKLNQELMDLAAQKRVALPRMIDPRSEFCIQNLQGEPTDTFDRCYARAQLALHMESVAAFKAQAQRGQDPEMKALAARALPKLKEHLKTIESIVERCEKARSREASHTDK